MNWGREFISQSYGRPTYKHKELPVYITDEFNFFRCVEFNDEFYGKTASALFNGNLRTCSGRYAKLFPNQKLSYWANSPTTARAEIKKHGAGKNILTFWAYDDRTSTFPILQNEEPLIIIDGRKTGVQELIDSTKSTVTSGTAFGRAAGCMSMCRFLLSPTARTRNTTPIRPATATLKRAPERPERAAKRQATALNLRPFGRMGKTASFPTWWTLPAHFLPAIRC